MTWRDADDNKIPYYATDENGETRLDSQGRPITNLTYDHDPPMVQRYNAEPDGGFNQTQQQRNDDFNDTSKLTPMGRSENSSKSGGLDEEGKPNTYRQDTGPNFKPKGSK
jgi:hypothetical protein